ncbi:MAG: hypothetical protein RLZZ387_4713 [Chloroflexota bacterium]|jgi:hypothetical protein
MHEVRGEPWGQVADERLKLRGTGRRLGEELVLHRLDGRELGGDNEALDTARHVGIAGQGTQERRKVTRIACWLGEHVGCLPGRRIGEIQRKRDMTGGLTCARKARSEATCDPIKRCVDRRLVDDRSSEAPAEPEAWRVGFGWREWLGLPIREGVQVAAGSAELSFQGVEREGGERADGAEPELA